MLLTLISQREPTFTLWSWMFRNRLILSWTQCRICFFFSAHKTLCEVGSSVCQVLWWGDALSIHLFIVCVLYRHTSNMWWGSMLPAALSVLYRCQCLEYICFIIHCLAPHFAKGCIQALLCKQNQSSLPWLSWALYLPQCLVPLSEVPTCQRWGWWKAEDSTLMGPELECFMDLSDFFITSLGRWRVIPKCLVLSWGCLQPDWYIFFLQAFNVT